MKRYKTAWFVLPLLVVFAAANGQTNLSGFSIVFEMSNPTADGSFPGKVTKVLRNQILFSGKMDFIKEDEWQHYKDKGLSDIVIDHFSVEHPKTVMIFKFILQKTPAHMDSDLRIFHVKVMNLKDRSTMDLCDAYVYPDDDEDIERVMAIPVAHMRSMIAGQYKRYKLHIVDNGELAGCNNYQNAVISFFTNPNLYDIFYVLLETNPQTSNRNSIVGVRQSEDSESVQFEFRERKNIVAKTPTKIDCNSLQPVYEKQINDYCKAICKFCKDHGYGN